MNGAPSQGAHDLDPLATRFGAPPALVLVSPPSVPAWSPPPPVAGDPQGTAPDCAAGTTPESAAGAPRCLDYQGQNCHGEHPLDRLARQVSEEYHGAWLGRVDVHWAPYAKRRAERLRARSLELARVPCYRPRGPGMELQPFGDPEAGRWHAKRAAGLGRSLESRVGDCGPGNPKSDDAPWRERGAVVVVACGCGPREVPVACKQRLVCPTCKQATYRRLRKKITRSLRAKMRAAWADWKAHAKGNRDLRRRPVLVTLTVRHSGDPALDRQRITDGWVKLRKWVNRRIGLTYGPAERASFDYAMVWEVTRGEDGRGHVHAHAVVLWPFLDWSLVRKAWLRATRCNDCNGRGRAGESYCRTCRGDGSHSTSIDLKPPRASSRTAGQAAANYLAKYTSKGVTLEEFEPKLAAAVLDSLWQRRVCSASRGFWQASAPCACKRCNKPFAVVEKPSARRKDAPLWAPAAFWRVELENGAVEERWCVPAS